MIEPARKELMSFGVARATDENNCFARAALVMGNGGKNRVADAKLGLTANDGRKNLIIITGKF